MALGLSEAKRMRMRCPWALLAEQSMVTNSRRVCPRVPKLTSYKKDYNPPTKTNNFGTPIGAS